MLKFENGIIFIVIFAASCKPLCKLKMRERILKILEEKDLNQAQFAEIIGVNPSSISHIMNGRDKFSQTVASNTLLSFPEINPMWFLKGEGEMYKISPENKRFQKEDNNLLFNEIEGEEKSFSFSESVENEINKNNTRIQGESNIRPSSDREQEIIDAKSSQISSSSIAKANNKKIEKIVFFYSDQTFEEYYPKQ